MLRLAKLDVHDSLPAIYAINGAMNQLVISGLDPKAWRASPPGLKRGGRTIAAIFAHLHNSRLVWIKHSAPHLKCPAPLDPDRCTMKKTAAAHRKSAEQCLRMLTDALSGDAKRRGTKFSRGSWTQTWPAGASMFAYMFSHEADHRGQIMLAHELAVACRTKPPTVSGTGINCGSGRGVSGQWATCWEVGNYFFVPFPWQDALHRQPR